MPQTENVTKIVDVVPSLERSMFIPVVLFILAMLYVLSPVDLIPDVPVVGQIDDLLVAAIATLNLFQQWLKGSSVFLSGLFGLAKWLLVFIGIVACSVMGMAVCTILKTITG